MKVDRDIIRKMIVEELLSEKVSGSSLKKDPEHIFKHVVRVGTKIYYQMKVVYTVTKLYPGGFLMTMSRSGNNPGLFAPKARIEKDSFISQVKMGFIKKVN